MVVDAENKVSRTHRSSVGDKADKDVVVIDGLSVASA